MPQKSSVKGKKTKFAATQIFLPISEIRDDVVVLKNGGLRAVIEVNSVNFSLKSEQEQNALIYSYQRFLNLLQFPIQIVVRSKKLDIDGYLSSFQKIAKNQNEPLMKNLTNNYVDYVEKLVEYADIMEKHFYLVIPYDPIRSRDKGMFTIFWDSIHPLDEISQIKQRHNEFHSLKRGLEPLISTIQTGITNCGLQISRLNTAQLVELYYQSFNPLVSHEQKIEDFSKQTILNM